MHISENGLAIIRRFEGFSAQIYLCPANYKTIGYGHVVHQDEISVFQHGIDVDIAELLLLQDCETVANAMRRLINVPLSQNQYDAIASFTFNLGHGALQRSTLRKKINYQEHEDVPRELLRWVWAGSRKLSGLVRRRQAEAQLYSLP